MGWLAWPVNGLTAVAVAAWLFGRLWPVNLASTHPLQFHLDVVAFFIRTLELQFALGVACFAVAVALLRRRRTALILAALSLVAAWPTLRTFAPHTPRATAGGDRLRVLSVNLLAWNATPDLLARDIAASPADVILAQEYSHDWHARLNPLLHASWPHIAAEPRAGCFGTAVYSKLPFAEPVNSTLPIGETDNPQQRAVVEFGGRAIALFNIHLLPPVGRSYIRTNRREFIDLEQILKAEKLPLAVCGDFNFTNSCAQADRLFALGFRDALDEGAWGPQWTWPAIGRASLFPGLRLDHVYLRGAACGVSAAVLPSRGSDHRPVLVELAWNTP